MSQYLPSRCQPSRWSFPEFWVSGHRASRGEKHTLPTTDKSVAISLDYISCRSKSRHPPSCTAHRNTVYGLEGIPNINHLEPLCPPPPLLTSHNLCNRHRFPGAEISRKYSQAQGPLTHFSIWLYMQFSAQMKHLSSSMKPLPPTKKNRKRASDFINQLHFTYP